ncbi:hypothetical protein KA525_03865 [Candidatus Woesebacteria bacterium]|nr:hypothetical protein [Candidatus Woesebacteria bacterium]
MIQYKIFTELDEIKQNYKESSLEKVSGLKRSQYQVIKMCEYYSDSRYLGTYLGNKKQIGSGTIDVPFYNIVNYRVAIAKTATDLDIKDIQIVSDNPKYQVHSMLLNREAYEWMKKAEFSRTLNEMGSVRPKYGGYLVKKCIEPEEDELEIEVVRWTNVWTDQNDILGGAIVECHSMSPIEINKKDGVWENVRDVLKAHKKIKAKDRPTTIEVYEITGEFPVALFKNSQEEEIAEDDEFKYSLQHYFIAEIDGKKFFLYGEELDGEMEDYYEYLAWEDNGYGLGRGVIEDSEEAQVWTNDAVINEHLAMTIAGRVGVKTNSKKLGNSVLEHDHGKIYELNANEDINSFSMVPAALGQYQNQIEKWRTQADNVTSSFDSITGEQPPANTPYSQTVFLNQVASRPFDYKREEWGIHLSKLFNKWVIPHLIKKIKKKHILVSEFSDEELENIDESFAVFNSNEDMVEKAIELLSKENITPEEQQGLIDTQGELINSYKDHIKKNGKKRFIEIPDGYFDDIEYKVTVVTTGEQKNKAATMQSLNEIMKTIQASFNPNTGEYEMLVNPELSKIFRELVELSGSGLSPISLGKGSRQPAQIPSPVSVPEQQSQPLAQ